MIVDQISSSSWSVPTARTVPKVTVITDLLPHDVRRVVGEVNDMKQMSKTEQHMACEEVKLVENLHDRVDTEG